MEVCCKCLLRIKSKSWYGLHKNCFEKWFNIAEAAHFSDLIARSQSQAPLEISSKNISFFHGAYKKYSAHLGGNNYILKVQQKEYPELPATEYLCNQIYQILGIDIPDYHLVRFPEEYFCFITKNFMSTREASDLVHIYHFVNGEKKHDCESLVNIIGEQTGRRTEQEKFVSLTLADILIGNHDRHGRNIGFIRSPKGIKLAPFYDNPSALAIEDHSFLGADLQPRGSIFTKDTDKPAMKDYIHEWNRLGYGEIITRFRKKYSFDKIQKLIKKSFIHEKRQKALIKLISQRGSELCEIT